jgi:hypothetical protein
MLSLVEHLLHSRFFLPVWAVTLSVILCPIPSKADSPPKISAKPASLNFGSVKAGGVSSPKNLTIANTGKSNLTVSSINLSGVNASDFDFSPIGGCSDAITPGGTACTLTVTFRPTAPFAKKSATLNISSNDPKKPSLSVKLSGQVLPPKISVTPTKLDFGSLNVGVTSATKPVTIKNTGVSDLEISSLTITGSHPSDFVQESNDSEFPPSTCPSTLPSGSSCNVNIRFTPHATGDRGASLNVLSDDPKKSAVVIKLSGKALSGSSATLSAPQNLTYKIEGETLTVKWAAVSGATGYRMSIGMQSGDYDATYDLGSITQIGPIDLSDVAHDTYYLSVKAYNAVTESNYSDEIFLVIAPPRYALSVDQGILLAEIGRPDYLTVLFNDDPKRREETWVYKDEGEMYLFWDGELIDGVSVEVDPNAYSNSPSVDPTFLTPDTTISDLVELLGTNYIEVDQSSVVDMIGDVNFKTYHFESKGLFVSFWDEKLIAALTTDVPRSNFTSAAMMQLRNELRDLGVEITPQPQPKASDPPKKDAALALWIIAMLVVFTDDEEGEEDLPALSECFDILHQIVDAGDPAKKNACTDKIEQAVDTRLQSGGSNGKPRPSVGSSMLAEQANAHKNATDVKPPCTGYIYSNEWSACDDQGMQTRVVIGKLPSGCIGDPPFPPETRACTPPPCYSITFSEWSLCSETIAGKNTRKCIKIPDGCIGECDEADLIQNCPPCTYHYGEWSACVNGKRTRSAEAWPRECGGGPPAVKEEDCTATYFGAFEAQGALKFTGDCPLCDNGDYTCTYNVTATGTVTVSISIESNQTYSGTATLSGGMSAPAGVSDCSF